jgi:hypothetical protein
MRSRVKFLKTASYKMQRLETASYKNAEKVYVHKTLPELGAPGYLYT